jgi:hypothetical protein
VAHGEAGRARFGPDRTSPGTGWYGDVRAAKYNRSVRVAAAAATDTAPSSSLGSRGLRTTCVCAASKAAVVFGTVSASASSVAIFSGPPWCRGTPSSQPTSTARER